MKNKTLIIISGPTASGKTDLTIKLAKLLNTEVISADSRLVYRDFNIGTAKPTTEEMQGVKHHLIDITDPTETYTASHFREDSLKIINNLFEKGKCPVVAGGTGFYIRMLTDNPDLPDVQPDQDLRDDLYLFAENNGNQALHDRLKQLDPVSAEKLHVNDLFRISRAIEVYEKTGRPVSSFEQKRSVPYNVLYVCLSAHNRDILYDRINLRVLNMLEHGLVEEVKILIGKYGKTLSLYKTLGYKEVVDFLESRCLYTQMISDIQQNTRHFARRQLIWFRPDERIVWYNIDKDSKQFIIEDIITRLNNNDR